MKSTKIHNVLYISIFLSTFSVTGSDLEIEELDNEMAKIYAEQADASIKMQISKQLRTDSLNEIQKLSAGIKLLSSDSQLVLEDKTKIQIEMAAISSSNEQIKEYKKQLQVSQARLNTLEAKKNYLLTKPGWAKKKAYMNYLMMYFIERVIGYF